MYRDLLVEYERVRVVTVVWESLKELPHPNAISGLEKAS